ncbi:MAG: hypothetical protein QOK00_61 [Thermoleophilaceae bacterium]|jgi:hypothetical protein|nr:hypothetical protein [Thermoleophilaceae bacterium]MEA2399658.1 hypothetical protein [Thermoleophilaceae bacterium]MEA2454735.1 hypothetical protein [Thermoleophilaceae bacterium]
MASRGLQRFAPLSGIVFVVLIVLAIVIGGETPDNNDSQRAIVDFWRDNDTAQMWSSIIGVWGTVFFVWFAASFYSTLRRAEDGPARLSAICFAGAIIGAVGLLSSLSLSFATADAVDDVPGSVTQTLTVLSNGFFFPIAGGYALFFLGAGVLALRTRTLPVWLGWVTLVLGIALVTPVGFFALIVGMVWILVVSVMLYRREAGPAGRAGPVEPAAPASVA